MKRQIYQNLKLWKADKNRKPLILKGPRQVGKTYILQTFGKQEYENSAYFNFEASPHLHELFNGSLKPQDILKILAIELGMEIKPEKTLIIFDEIQECPAALNSLKYFNEMANEYHVCSSGSLLGITLANTKGFPVGKVDFMTLYPLSFDEFLQAKNQHDLIQYMDEIHKLQPLPAVVHEKLLGLFKTYIFTGGMPAVVNEYITTEDFTRIRTAQNNILNAYRLDFAKHAPQNIIMKINQVWDVIPSQLGKENKKFIYSVIRQGARAQEFETAIQWLTEAGLIHKVHHINAPKMPLIGYVDHPIFKVYLVDVGLLGAMAGLSAKSIIYGNDLFQEFRGSYIENYVTQELARQQFGLFYWTSSGQAELDFILQLEDNIYPIEVKSGTTSMKKSLITYMQKYQPKIAVRLSPMNLKMDGEILNCPLYFMARLSNLICLI